MCPKSEKLNKNMLLLNEKLNNSKMYGTIMKNKTLFLFILENQK